MTSQDGLLGLFRPEHWYYSLMTLGSDPVGNGRGKEDVPSSTNINNVINQRADLGARENRVTAMQNQLDSTSVNLQQSLSNVQSADVAQTITDYTNQQTTYKAALSIGAQIIQVSLVDFLK